MDTRQRWTPRSRNLRGRTATYYVRGDSARSTTRRGSCRSTFNLWAPLCWGRIWAAGARGLGHVLDVFLILEVIAWVQIGRGLHGATPGCQIWPSAQRGRRDRATGYAGQRAAGRDRNRLISTRLSKLAGNLQASAADRSLAQADAAHKPRHVAIMVTGLRPACWFSS